MGAAYGERKVMGNSVRFEFGDVRRKSISTPNQFVSHMLEHIAWRMGLQLWVTWEDENWRGLGQALGEEIRVLPARGSESAALGMIDDGAAIVSIDRDAQGVVFHARGDVDLDWFLSLRCEQAASGEPMKALMEGIAEGLRTGIVIEVLTLEDTHHTWEGIYRALGIALSRMYTPQESAAQAEERMIGLIDREHPSGEGELVVEERWLGGATVRRGTAETGVSVRVRLDSPPAARCTFDVDRSIDDATNGFPELLRRFAEGLGAEIEIHFVASYLSSSHVVMEDIGLALGRALLETMRLRMMQVGINGAGSTVHLPAEAATGTAAVGVSVEGRKFWRFVPDDGDYRGLRRALIVGADAGSGLRGEDLDDFVDGLSGGISGSIMVLIRRGASPAETWGEVMEKLGAALREAFRPNPYRQGVPPGVKATLA